MRAVLEQERKIVSTFSWRLNKAQLKYAMTSHELPLEVKACQLFAQIIRGCEIWSTQIISMGAMHTNFSQFWVPTGICSIKETDNIAADSLRWLPMADDNVAINQDIKLNGILLLVRNLDHKQNNNYALDMWWIVAAQSLDEAMQKQTKYGKHSKSIRSIVFTSGACLWIWFDFLTEIH